MREVTVTEKTVEAAVEKGLLQLKTKKENVNIHIIDYGKKSFLGMFGGKPAIVRISLKEHVEAPLSFLSEIKEFKLENMNPVNNEIDERAADSKNEDTPAFKRNQTVVEEIEKYLISVLSEMDIQADIEIQKSGKEVIFKILSKDASIIIGRRGQVLNALQYLCQLVSNQKQKHYLSIILDVENYREKRKKTLMKLAEQLSNQVISTKKSVELEPMPAFERKIIHSYLAEKKAVKTESVGEGSNRYLVIHPRKNK